MRRLLAKMATMLRIRPRTVRVPAQGRGPDRAATTTTVPRPGRPAPGRRTATVPATPPRVDTAAPHARSAPRTAGRVLAYAPQLDGRADPGEIVWTWVPYEEDASQGKDRPVLVVGRDGSTLQGLMLSSNSDRDGQRHWLGLGPGTWDGQRRPSWIRLDRVLEVDEDGIRREGAILDRQRFDAVADELRRHYGWH